MTKNIYKIKESSHHIKESRQYKKYKEKKQKHQNKYNMNKKLSHIQVSL
jgi:hypothetical protein